MAEEEPCNAQYFYDHKTTKEADEQKLGTKEKIEQQR